MTWERIASAAFAALVGIVSWAFAAGSTWTTQAALPGQIAAIEREQKARQDATDQHFQHVQQDITTVKQDVSRVEGKVDTVINLLRARK